MKVEIRDSYTRIFLTHEEVLELCKPGKEENTCIWCMVGHEGFECHYFYRPTGLMSRWRQGLTSAKRNGCEKVKSMNYEVRSVEAHTLSDIISRKEW